MAGSSTPEVAGVLTELRVHGVSGTPPEALLRLPAELIELVAGDQAAGFYGPRFDLTPGQGVGQPAAVEQPERWRRDVQAYSWGGLTSGPATRAVWLLFLPFVLVNLAHWMLPPVTRPAASAMAVRLLRMLGLTLTLTLMLAAAVSAADVAGWQCSALGDCVSHLGPASVLGTQTAGARVALSAVPVLILILLLWRLGQEDPRRVGLPPDPAASSGASPLETADFWKDDLSVTRLRACHVAAWAAGLGALVLAAPLRYGVDWTRPVALGLLGVDGVVLAAATMATWVNRATGRGGPGVPDWVTAALMSLRWVALAAAVASLLVVGFGPLRNAEIPVPSHLPALRGAIYVLLAVQVVLLIGLFAAVAMSLRGRRSDAAPSYGPTLRGFTAPIVATLGWLIGVGFSVGVTLMVTVRLGDPVSSTARAKERVADAALIVPPPYLWSAAANLVLVVAIVMTALYVWRRIVPRLARDQLAGVLGDEGTVDPGRAKTVATDRGWAALTDRGVNLIAGLIAFWVLLIAVCVVVYLATTFDYVSDHLPTITKLGVLATASLTAAFVGLAVRAFRDRQLRRLVGVLWDVITFWPRANHPLTPPCYGERAVPELLLHIGSLIGDGTPPQRVVVAAHSQGTIIAAAALMLADAATCLRVGLLTFGSPLRRLYARNFPAYFGHYALSSVRAAEDGRWINLWALSDPIGGYVFDDRNRVMVDALDTVDVRLPDTTSLAANPDGTHPPVCGHSGFWTRPEYGAALALLELQVVPAEAVPDGPRPAPPRE